MGTFDLALGMLGTSRARGLRIDGPRVGPSGPTLGWTFEPRWGSLDVGRALRPLRGRGYCSVPQPRVFDPGLTSTTPFGVGLSTVPYPGSGSVSPFGVDLSTVPYPGLASVSPFGVILSTASLMSSGSER